MVNRRISILYIVDYFHRTGGTEKHLAQLISGLPPDTFRCSLVVFDLGQNQLLEGLRKRGIPVISLPVGREYTPQAAVQAWRLSRLIRENHYDIVQTLHQKADTFGALVAWLSGVRQIVSSKRDTGHQRKAWHFFANRRLKSVFKSFIVVAEAVGVAVMRNDRAPASRIVTIYNGVDTRHFAVPTAEQKRTARAGLGYAETDFVVGMVAGFRPEKNHDVFFAGLAQALPALPSLKVLVVGGGQLLGEYRKRLATTELGSRTLFTGHIADVVPYVSAMDIGCLTSGTYEGFSNAILEQMSVGLPMIVSDVGGNPEAVVDGKTGRVIPALDPGALARALVDAHADTGTVAAMGRAARRRVEDLFSLERMCAEHARLYLSLCEQTQSP